MGKMNSDTVKMLKYEQNLILSVDLLKFNL